MLRSLISCVLTTVVVAQDWTTVSSLHVGATGFDPVRGRMVRVAMDRSTWEWDGTDWFRRAALLPTNMQPVAMVFDRLGQRLVAFAPNNALLAYDGEQWQPVAEPPGGYVQAIAYDDHRDRLVALTGVNGPAATWEYDGTNWLRVTTTTSPSMPLFVSVHQIAYDGVTQRVMLVRPSSLGPLAEIWWYDGVDWTVQTTGTPPYRSTPSYGYDPVRGRLVMYGGLTFVNQLPVLIYDVWEWDGVTWTQVTNDSGGEFSGSSLCFDPVRGHLLMLSITRQVHRWDGSNWIAAAPPLGPAGNPRLSTELLLGKPIATTATDTWEWDSRRWVRTAAGQPGIQATINDAGGALIGMSTTTMPGAWLWVGSWLPLATPAALPPPRNSFTLAADTLRNRVVLFGGQDAQFAHYADTWEWNGAQWSQVVTAHAPSPRFAAKAVFDPVRARTLLVGGTRVAAGTPIYQGDTWVYDGVDWTQPSSAPAPFVALGNEQAHALRFDAARGKPTATQFHDNLVSEYEHDGVAWVWRGDVATQFRGGGNMQMAFEPRRGTWLAFDGGTLVRLPTVASAADTTGTACGAALHLLARTAPVIGEPAFGFDVRGAAGPALIGLSGAAANVPIGGGCTLYLQGLDALLGAVANSGGFAETRIPIPDDPVLRGLTVFAQAAQLDAASAIGIAASRRLALTVGN